MPKLIRERIFITVKTYPTLSNKYGELVCTAGLREDGTWIRLYPIPFRLLEAENRYRKYQWIEIDVEKNPKDPRPESYRPCNFEDAVFGEVVPSNNKWRERNLIIERSKTFTNRAALVEQTNSTGLSLATFRPTQVKRMIAEPCEREWDSAKIEKALTAIRQDQLFDTEEERVFRRNFQPAKKIPYHFKYVFYDDAGNEMRLMVEDWEIGMLFLNCREKYDEKTAVEKTIEKYESFIETADLRFFLGTTLKFQNRRAPNPFVIIGVYPAPPKPPCPLFEGLE